MAKVLIADRLAETAIETFRVRGIEVDVRTGLAKRDLIDVIGDYDGLAVRSATRADADVIKAASRLQVIGRAGIGVDNIDIHAATENGVIVMNAPHGNAITTAEHAIALMFAAARQIPAASARTQAGEWPKRDFMGVELTGKTIGLIGCGNVGSIVAEKALGLKMKVLACDPLLTEARATEIGARKVELDTLLDKSDVVSLHTPLTERTRNILSANALRRLRKGAIVVNCARGGLVDELALREALDEGRISAAALDVFTSEPATDSPLFGAPNFVATPHLGASSHEAQDKVAVQIAEQMSDCLLNGAVANSLNTPSISAEDAPRLRPVIDLAAKLGQFAGQMAGDGLRAVEIECEGEFATLNIEPLVASATAGLLRPIIPEVNLVSAPALLAQQAIELKSSRRESSPVYDGVVRVVARTDERHRSVAGTLIHGNPRIVEVDAMALDARFRPFILMVNNLDTPGFVGFLGTALGDAGVNIATFNLGREGQGGQAIALVGLDQEPPADLLGHLRSNDQVRFVRLLRF